MSDWVDERFFRMDSRATFRKELETFGRNDAGKGE